MTDYYYGDNNDNNLYGSITNDNVMYGFAGNDTLNGGNGNDYLDGGLGNDILYGWGGDDTYVVNSTEDMEVGEDADQGIDTVLSSVTYYTLNPYFENLILTGAATNGTGNDIDNTITGNGYNNVLYGGTGADTLYGGAGNDTLDGELLDYAAGADTLYGGAGNDTYTVDNAADTVDETITGSGGTDLVQASVTYTLGTDVENLTLTGTAAINGTGNGLSNTITGNSAANALYGYGGDDTLTGGDGNDTYGVSSAGDNVSETGTGTDTVESYDLSYTLGTNLENLTLTGTAATNGTGNSLNNTLSGNSAANTLSGDAGNDYLYGSNGNDTLNGGNDNDTLDGGAGADTLDGGSGNDLLNGWADADTLTGGLGTDTYAFGTVTGGADTVTDFASGTDKLRFRSDDTLLNIGDGDTVLDSSELVTGPGGFLKVTELVVVSGDISGTITNTLAAAAIGSASATYAVDDTRLFAVDNGTDSALYLFQSGDTDAAVESTELTLIGTLQGTGTAGTVLADYTFA
jgi:Ca2+-binding RTX toxin-like protein